MDANTQEKQVKCLKEREIYEEILNRIDNKRPASYNRKGDYLKSINLSSSNYYLIRKFVAGDKLPLDRNKPLSEEKMIELMEKIGIRLINPAYIVEM